MKTRMFTKWSLGLLVMSLPSVGGCFPESGSNANETNSPSQPAPAVVASVTATNAVPVTTNTAADPAAAPAKPTVPDPAAAASKPLPPDMAVSPSLGEVVKMANAGVDEGVMLAFITNSAGTFNLGSSQIIYMSDLGISSPVITAMIFHDQEIVSGARPLLPSTVPSPPSSTPAAELTSAAAVPVSAAAPEATAPAPAADTAAAGAYAPTFANSPPPQAEAQAAPQQTVVNYNYFYDSLSPYGNWVNLDGYGWCWQPTVTVIHRDWRPYGDRGRWIYTDSGWYWQSDYSWGGIAFHYGRWFNHPHRGWCWWPDRVWGPSWVTWRYDNDYCGWAPLPPFTCWSSGLGFTYYGASVGVGFSFGFGWNHYTYVPWHRFHDRYPHRYALAGNRATQVHHNSTVINNIINGNNNTIINGGVSVQKVSSFTRSEVHKVAIRDVPAGPARTVQPDRVAKERGKLVVYRPALPPAASSDVASRAVPSVPTRAAGAAPITRRAEPGRTGLNAAAPSGGVVESRPTLPRPTASGRPPVRDPGDQPVRSAPPSPTVSKKEEPRPVSRPAAPPPSAPARKDTTYNVRAPQPAKITDPIIWHQTPTISVPSVPRTESSVRPPAPQNSPTVAGDRNRGTRPSAEPGTSGSPISSPRATRGPEAASTVAKAGPTTTWQNETASSSASRPSPSSGPSASAPTTATRPLAPTFSRPQEPARPARQAESYARREVVTREPRFVEPSYSAPRYAPSPSPTPAQPRVYSPPPASRPSYTPPPSYSPPPSRPSYTPPPSYSSPPASRSAPSTPSSPSMSSPAPSRPSPAPSSPSGGSGRRSNNR